MIAWRIGDLVDMHHLDTLKYCLFYSVVQFISEYVQILRVTIFTNFLRYTFLCSKAHNKYVVQILIIRFWAKFILYFSFNFRLKSLLFLGVQYRWSFPPDFLNSTSFSEAELCWLEGAYSHREYVFTLSAKGVNSLFLFQSYF